MSGQGGVDNVEYYLDSAKCQLQNLPGKTLCIITSQRRNQGGYTYHVPNVTTSFPGYSLYFEKVPWLRLVTCLSIPTQAAQRVGPQLNFVNTTL